MIATPASVERVENVSSILRYLYRILKKRPITPQKITLHNNNPILPFFF